ncbi:cation channel sperm-associated protein 4 [Sphaerodactylus townsendi]|uniref:cation channel sperm-associated protein 4 n=1 Tax=Sphaerodactylus townsendi TaxID=933632 RepID=UPI002025E1E1|nr:cation channel sperm-associated protein 4 [Sphaerodactylus townsendi]
MRLGETDDGNQKCGRGKATKLKRGDGVAAMAPLQLCPGPELPVEFGAGVQLNAAGNRVEDLPAFNEALLWSAALEPTLKGVSMTSPRTPVHLRFLALQDLQEKCPLLSLSQPIHIQDPEVSADQPTPIQELESVVIEQAQTGGRQNPDADLIEINCKDITCIQDNWDVEEFVSHTCMGTFLHHPAYKLLLAGFIITNAVNIALRSEPTFEEKYYGFFSAIDTIVLAFLFCEVFLNWYYGFSLYWKIWIAPGLLAVHFKCFSIPSLHQADFNKKPNKYFQKPQKGRPSQERGEGMIQRVREGGLVATKDVTAGPPLPASLKERMPPCGAHDVEGAFGFLPKSGIMRLMQVCTLVAGLGRMIKVILKSAPDMFNIMVLLFVIMLVFSVFGVTLFGSVVPVHFGNLGTALYTLFICITQDGWISIYDAFDDEGFALKFGGALYFFIFITCGAFICANLLVAVVTTNLEQSVAAYNEQQQLQTLAQSETAYGELDDGTDDDARPPLSSMHLKEIMRATAMIRCQDLLSYGNLGNLNDSTCDDLCIVLEAIHENLKEYQEIRVELNQIVDEVRTVKFNIEQEQEVVLRNIRGSTISDPVLTKDVIQGRASDVLSALSTLEKANKIETDYQRGALKEAALRARRQSLLTPEEIADLVCQDTNVAEVPEDRNQRHDGLPYEKHTTPSVLVFLFIEHHLELTRAAEKPFCHLAALRSSHKACSRLSQGQYLHGHAHAP